MVQMLGWFRADAARASRRKRSNANGSCAVSSGRDLRATSRPREVSSALYTTPMPPEPSGPSTRQWEIVWPVKEEDDPDWLTPRVGSCAATSATCSPGDPKKLPALR